MGYSRQLDPQEVFHSRAYNTPPAAANPRLEEAFMVVSLSDHGNIPAAQKKKKKKNTRRAPVANIQKCLLSSTHWQVTV